MAQDTNQITLKYDDGTGVSGALIDFSDGFFRIQASVGLIAIPAEEVSCIGAACPAGTEFEVPPAPVTLTSFDASMRISGDVIEFVEGVYVVATDLGELRIEASLVTCEGEGCVESAHAVSREVVLENGSTTISGDLLGIEDGAYIIETDQFGQIRVDVDMFECRGDACP